MRLSPHLSHETDPNIACTCGCGYGMHVDHLDLSLAWTIERLQFDVSRHVGREVAINVHCWARCQAHNAAIDGHVGSQHMGRPIGGVSGAMDFHIPTVPHALTAELLARYHRGGIGVYSWGIHADTGSLSRWPRGWWRGRT